MHGDSRDRWRVCLATANLPASLTVNSLFPQSPRWTFFMPAPSQQPETPGWPWSASAAPGLT